MSLRFLVDAQLPPAPARWLEQQGHEAVHVHDTGLATATDRQIWAYAAERKTVIVSKDDLLAGSHARRCDPCVRYDLPPMSRAARMSSQRRV